MAVYLTLGSRGQKAQVHSAGISGGPPGGLRTYCNLTHGETKQMHQLGLSSFFSEVTNVIMGSRSHDII